MTLRSVQNVLNHPSVKPKAIRTSGIPLAPDWAWRGYDKPAENEGEAQFNYEAATGLPWEDAHPRDRYQWRQAAEKDDRL